MSKFDSDRAFKSIIKGNKSIDNKNNKNEKTKISLSLYKRTYDNIKKIAYVDRKTATDIITESLNEYIDKNIQKLEEYEKLQ